MEQTPERTRCFKLTDDDWNPSYKMNGYHQGVKNPNLVEVSFIQFCNNEGWRVCVWGADDSGMEKDFPHNQRNEAWQLFSELLNLATVNRGKLKDLGFVNA